jgi:hypothetical protein
MCDEEESQGFDEKAELPQGITDAQLQKLIAEKRRAGATSCEVVKEGGTQFLVCHFPPL